MLSLKKATDDSRHGLLIAALPLERRSAGVGLDKTVDGPDVVGRSQQDPAALLLSPYCARIHELKAADEVRVVRLRKDVLYLSHVVLMATSEEAYHFATQEGRLPLKHTPLMSMTIEID